MIHADSEHSPVGRLTGKGVVENGVVWDDRRLAAAPELADPRTRGGIFGTAESW